MTASASLDAPPLRSTALEAIHAAAGATFTAFCGWRLPLRFTGEVVEHQAVREATGIFDISHMGQITVNGPGAADILSGAIVSDVADLAIGRARYSMLCDENGGVLDDLIVYRLGESEMYVISNAANTSVVLAAIAAKTAGRDVDVADVTDGRSLFALQGPAATNLLATVLDPGAMIPSRFRIAAMSVAGAPALVARTGYTGEDGVELSVAADDAERVWTSLRNSAPGVICVGLAARDSLRLEAGLPLYGHELDAAMTPFDAGFGRVVDLDHRFPGRDAIVAAEAAGTSRRLVGLLCDGKRSARQGYRVLDLEGAEIGVVTSGGPSPTLGVPIALAYVDRAHTAHRSVVEIDIRNRLERATVVPMPFLTSVPRTTT